MTFPQSGVAALTAATINTTAAQAATQVLAPVGNNPQGTPQGGVIVTYPALYGSAAAQLNTPGSIPAQNGYMIPNALPSPGSVNGVMAAPLNVQNQAARPDVSIPNTFDLIYQQLITMAAYVSKI